MKMDPFNSKEQMESASPDTLKFHSTFKAIARMMIKYLPFAKVDEERYAPALVGNAKVLYEIIKEWETHDSRTHRKDILTKPLLVGLFTYFFDSDFREVFNFMIWRVIQRQGELFFPPGHLDPSAWTDDSGQRNVKGAKVPPGAVLQLLPYMVVLNIILPPQLYSLEIDGTYYGTNTNRPAWVGDGWAYPLLCTWGDEEAFRNRSVLGDLP